MFDRHILRILEAQSAPEAEEQTIADESQSLLPKSNLPEWCQIDMSTYLSRRSSFLKWVSPWIPNRQDSLYWLEKRGPMACLVVFQIQLVYLSTYCALLAVEFIPYIFQEYSTNMRCIYLIFSILPIILIKQRDRFSIRNMSIASCIGCHRLPQVIAQVNREDKVDQIILALLLFEKVHNTTDACTDDRICLQTSMRSDPVEVMQSHMRGIKNITAATIRPTPLCSNM